VVGIGQTRFAKVLEGRTELDMACEAVVNALDDAGIDPSEVDGTSSYTLETTEEFDLARTVGFGDLTFFSRIGYGGGAGCATIAHAAMAIATGQANVVVCWRSRKRGGGRRPWAGQRPIVSGHWQWSRPFGLARPVDEIAMLTRRYMHEYGATRDHLANVALAARRHANRNPHAVMADREMTRDQYMGARWISEPLCLFDSCLETDGAAAVAVTSAERAADTPHRPAYIHAAAQGMHPQHQTMTNFFCDDPLRGPAWSAASLLWRQAEVGPADVDVAQLYDAFSPLILLSLEGYGFCERGEGGPFTDGGAIEVGGRLPVNTSGAGMSEVYLHGFNLINEGVRQIRGTSTSQVEGAEVSLVTSGEGVPTSAALFVGK